MENREAIEILKRKIHDPVPKAAVGAREENEAIYMAISALEKQEGKKPLAVETNIYDQEEIHHNCAVQVLRNSVTGEVSVGWWKEG